MLVAKDADCLTDELDFEDCLRLSNLARETTIVAKAQSDRA